MPQNWSSGTYTYDGAGNVTKTGNAYYLYDTRSRLVTANLYASILGTGTAIPQSFTYDDYANLTHAAGINIPASATTKRLTGSVSYDAAGNLTACESSYRKVTFERYEGGGDGARRRLFRQGTP